MQARSPRAHLVEAIAVRERSEPAPDAPVDAASSRRLGHWLLLLVGVALLVALIYQTGPRRLFDLLLALGWGLPLVFLPYALAAAFDTSGWRATFVAPRPFWGLLYVVRLVGEAVNSITPTAYLGGEPVKAYVLQRFGIPLDEGTASVILAKTALTIAQIAFVILGIGLFLARRGSLAGQLPALTVLLASGVIVASLLVYWQRRGLVTFVAVALVRVFPRAAFVARLRRRAADIDVRLYAFYGERRTAAAASVALHFVGWVAGALEVFAIMELIGRPVGLLDALVIEALAQPARLAGLFIPGTLGVQEAGGMVIFALLGLEPELGLALMLLKRLREIGYSLTGLALLAHLRPREVRSAAHHPSAPE